MKRRVFRVLVALAICYSLFVFVVMFFQRRLIYFPTKLYPKIAEQMATKEGFLPWRNKAGQIIGWKFPASTLPTASVLIVHGNAGCALDRDYFAKPIHAAASVDVYALEYPGYGAREGSPTKRSLCAAAEEAFEILPANIPKFVVGESIGAGVAAHLAKIYRPKLPVSCCSSRTMILVRWRRTECRFFQPN